MLQFLSGHRTYALAILGALLTLAHSLEYIGSDVYATLMGLIGAGTAASLRAGIAKAEAKVETTGATVTAKVSEVAQDTAIVSAQVAEVKDKVVEAVATPSVIVRPGS